MIDKSILKEKAMMLPIEYDGDFHDAVDNALEEYINLLVNYAADTNLINDVKKFRDSVDGMLKEYYLGHQHKAYEAFDTAQRNLLNGTLMNVSDFPQESLYRARVNSGDKAYQNDEMFHIKYSLRGKVATQRFSFPGLPCLYLGASSYACWLELNRPQIDQFQVALIRQSKDRQYKTIDLSTHPLMLYRALQGGNEDIDFEGYLRWWPMIAMCSIAVKNEGDAFKPEYIFPQFVLQYLLEGNAGDEIIGIKYMSIKAGKVSKKQYETDYRTYTNYVVPIKSEIANEEGFCPKVSDIFAIVRNYDGKELQILSDAIRKSGIVWHDLSEPEPQPLDLAKLYSTNDTPFPYSKTVFRRIEIILDNKDNSKFDDSGALVFEPISNDEIDALFEDKVSTVSHI